MSDERLENLFHSAMLGIYEEAKSRCKYNAARFVQMVQSDGGLKTAKKLLATSTPSDGFTTLWQCQCLDMTVEFFVLKPEFRALFEEYELQVAKQRLIDYGFEASRIPK